MAWNYRCPECGATLDPGERCEDCAKREDLRMITMEEWESAGSFDLCASPGDAVEEAIVDEFMNCVPPATLRRDLMQCGEPHDSRQDQKTGRHRLTYTTFEKRDGIWYYCGNCFIGCTTVPDLAS